MALHQKSPSLRSFLLCLLVSIASAQDADSVYTTDEVTITASSLQEERRIGPYKQPEWTTHRRFPSTRVYIQALPGTVEFEQWLEVRVPKADGKKSETRMRTEFAFGLGNRMQLDLYLLSVHVRDEARSAFSWRGWSAELRWAFADWGVLPGNPTLYFEYILLNGGPDKIEPKLLLGGELGIGWRWGLNLKYERELAGWPERTEEYAVLSGLSYTLFDRMLAVGPSFGYTNVIERGQGESSTLHEVLAGFSLQFRLHEKAYLDLEPLFGVTPDSKKLKMFIVFGWRL